MKKTRVFKPSQHERARQPAGDFRNRRRSVSGPLIWRMDEAFVPEVLPAEHQQVADPDGFCVFGRYPVGFIDHVVKAQILGDVGRDEILHVCSGTLGPEEKWTVDLRLEARPRVVATGNALPFADDTFEAVMLDPPYSDDYARELYRVENPRPRWLLREASRVVKPGGRIGLLHVAIPFPPPRCSFVTIYGIATGLGYRIRAFTVFEKRQPGMIDDPDDWKRAKRELIG